MSVHVGGAENLQFAAKVGRVGESIKFKYQSRREASAFGHHVGTVTKLQATQIHSLWSVAANVVSRQT